MVVDRAMRTKAGALPVAVCGKTWSLLLAMVMFLASVLQAHAQDSYPLGALIPVRDGTRIPNRLAHEWNTAFRVALEVLNDPAKFPQYKDFRMNGWVGHSDCDFDVASKSAKWLISQNVIGVVGAACSESSMSAALQLAPLNISLVSYASTARSLGDQRSTYPTFFRVVYSDKFQGQAIREALAALNYTDALNIKRKYGLIYNSNERYSAELYGVVSDAGGGAYKIDVGPVLTTTATTEDIAAYLASNPLLGNSDTIPVLLLMPNDAERVWAALLVKLNYNEYPWRYFASDGGTCVDPIGEGEVNAELLRRLQGQIGIAPFWGAHSDDAANPPPIKVFLDYWRTKSHAEYPGLVTLFPEKPDVEPRSYVPYLIDAVHCYYEAVRMCRERGIPVTGPTVMDMLRDPDFRFQGATDMVRFDVNQERLEDPGFSYTTYNFVNLIQDMWAPKALWSSKEKPGIQLSADAISQMVRPGPLPDNSGTKEANPDYNPSFSGSGDSNVDDSNLEGNKAVDPQGKGKKKLGGGAIFGVILVVVVVLAVAAGGVWYWKKRQAERRRGFVLML